MKRSGRSAAACRFILACCGSDTRKGVKGAAPHRELANRGISHCLPVLHAAIARGTLPAFPTPDREHAAPNPDLQHSVPHGRQSRQRDDAAPGRDAEYRWGQGLLRRRDAVVRLLRDRPHGFSVLTGEDALFYTALTQGADGGILASAHVRPQAFATIRDHILRGDQPGALLVWRALSDLPRLLFAEPSPAPIKYWLWRDGTDRQRGMRFADDLRSARLSRRGLTGNRQRSSPVGAHVTSESGPAFRRTAC